MRLALALALTLAVPLPACRTVSDVRQVDQMSEDEFASYVAAVRLETGDWAELARVAVAEGDLHPDTLPTLAALLRLAAGGTVPLEAILGETQETYAVAGLRILLRRLTSELEPLSLRYALVLNTVADALDPPDLG